LQKRDKPKRKKNQRQFGAIPARALADQRLHEIHFRALGIVALHDGRSGPKGEGCWAKFGTLADEIGKAISSLSEAIKELRIWGYLKHEKHPKDARRLVLKVVYDEENRSGQGERTPEIVRDVVNELVRSFSPQTVGNLRNDPPIRSLTRSLIREENQNGSVSPFGPDGQGSPSPEKSIQDSDEKVVRLRTSQPSSSPECPSAEQREAYYQRLQNLKRSLNGGGR
jgi:hypothetical protein